MTPEQLQAIKDRWVSPGAIVEININESFKMCDAIKDLLAEIEKLKCCGNCNFRDCRRAGDYCNNGYDNGPNVCDNWEGLK